MNDRDGAPGPQLPDFAGGGHGDGAPQLPDFAGGGHGSRGVMLAVLLGGAGFLVVVIAVVALVLSQTLFAGGPEVPTAGGGTTAAEPEDPKTPEESRSPEDVPTEEQTDADLDKHACLADTARSDQRNETVGIDRRQHVTEERLPADQ